VSLKGRAAAGAAAFLLSVFAAVPLAAAAQKDGAATPYPTKPIRLLVPFAPGGSADITARLASAPVGQALGQTIVIDNRPGSGGTIATLEAARATADGYTLGFTSGAQLGISPALHAKLGYDPIKDFVHVIHLTDNVFVLVVNPAVPAATVKEFIAYTQSNRGKVNAGSTGNGTYTHLTLELFKAITGADLTHVPYKGAAPAINDLLGRQIQSMFVTIASVQPYIASARVRALGVTAAKRSLALPDVPTFTEAGVPGLLVSSWFGISAPAGTPPPIVARLSAEYARALQVPEVRERLLALGSDLVGQGGEPFARLVRDDVVRWGKVVRAANVKVD